MYFSVWLNTSLFLYDCLIHDVILAPSTLALELHLSLSIRMVRL